MGKYDIDSELTPECRLSLNDLVEELDDELNLYENIDTYKDKFKNYYKSGLIDKLNKLLRFDIEKLGKKSDKEKFDMLKLLKVLFLIEKFGIPKRYAKHRDTKDIRIRIIDILAKPRLSNVNSYLSEASQYGEIIDNLIDDIKSNVDDADMCIDMIERIDDYWQYIAGKQFDYVFSDTALHNHDDMLTELKRINKRLEEIINNIDISAQQANLHSEGVMKTFFNILLTHRQLCYDIDRIRVNEYIDIDFTPSKEYTQLYLQHESKLISLSSLSFLMKSIDKSEKDDERLLFFNLASYYKNISPDDYKHYKYALDRAPIVLRWLMAEKPDADYSTSVPLTVLVAVIQEIVYVKKNIPKFKIRNDFYGYNADETSLLSTLKHEEEPAPILLYVWVRRIETRFAVNYGASDLIAEKNKAELNLLRVKEFIYGFRNMDDLKHANTYLLHKVAIAHTNAKVAAEIEDDFRFALTEKLRVYGVVITRFVFEVEPENVYDLFREVLAAYGDDIAEKIDEIAEKVCKCILEAFESNTYSDAISVNLNIADASGITKECCLDFKYDEIGQIFLYQRFRLIYPDDELDRLLQLGIKK